jgi:hypothetical protein
VSGNAGEKWIDRKPLYRVSGLYSNSHVQQVVNTVVGFAGLGQAKGYHCPLLGCAQSVHTSQSSPRPRRPVRAQVGPKETCFWVNPVELSLGYTVDLPSYREYPSPAPRC